MLIKCLLHLDNNFQVKQKQQCVITNKYLTHKKNKYTFSLTNLFFNVRRNFLTRLPESMSQYLMTARHILLTCDALKQ